MQSNTQKKIHQILEKLPAEVDPGRIALLEGRQFSVNDFLKEVERERGPELVAQFMKVILRNEIPDDYISMLAFVSTRSDAISVSIKEKLLGSCTSCGPNNWTPKIIPVTRGQEDSCHS